MRAGHLGMITTPMQGNAMMDGVRFCADNGVFGEGYPGDDPWFAWLSGLANRGVDCAFVVAPDVVCDHQRTYRRSDPWLERVRALGLPVAYVAQNGARPYNVPWHRFDVLFLGGDTEWKLGPAARDLVAEANQRGIPAHMGRVNSEKRIRYAHAIGCESADGTHIARGPDINLPEVLAWLRGINDQGPLWT